MRFVRSRVHTIDPAEDDNLMISYTAENGEKKSEEFDLVVLSVAMEVSDSAKRLAKTVQVDLNKHDFIDTGPATPVASSRAGIYVCGSMQGPKDIPSRSCRPRPRRAQ